VREIVPCIILTKGAYSPAEDLKCGFTDVVLKIISFMNIESA
jgi:hypothetical protein